MSTTIDDDDESMSEFEQGYVCGAEASRAAMTTDIRNIIDFISSELRALRIEVCKAAGLPEPQPLDDGMNGRRSPRACWRSAPPPACRD